jgi:integrase
MIVRGQIESNERQRQELAGEPVRTLDKRFSPDAYRMDKDYELPIDGPSISGLLERYIKKRKPKPPTVKAYRLHLQPFCDFIQHDDAARVTAKDVIRWKDELQTRISQKGKPFSPNTINGNYLRVLRIVLGFAHENLLIPSNPALGIKVRTARNTKPARRGLTDAEALTILEGTLISPSSRMSPQGKLARRWIPWICAFTGSRVNEITQARAEDISQFDAIWTIHITPDAGTTKNDRERTVAIHPQIIEQGFLNAISGLSGPLFYDPENSRGGSAANPQ